MKLELNLEAGQTALTESQARMICLEVIVELERKPCFFCQCVHSEAIPVASILMDASGGSLKTQGCRLDKWKGLHVPSLLSAHPQLLRSHNVNLTVSCWKFY